MTSQGYVVLAAFIVAAGSGIIITTLAVPLHRARQVRALEAHSVRTVTIGDSTRLMRLGECAVNQEIWAVIPSRRGWTGRRSPGREYEFVLLDDSVVSAHHLPPSVKDREAVAAMIECVDVTREMTGSFRFADLGPSLGNFPADGDVADELLQLLLAH